MELGLVSDALGRAVEAADRLGLDTTAARSVATTIEERTGYPGDLYVLALAGGTGVGKSSLLNAIAGEEVSPVGVRRPTTSSPVAWLPADRLADATPLLDWLGGAEVRPGPEGGPPVAIVDLPDLDSVDPGHAARVEAVLPRVDAVLWVTDPEKYQDAALHDRYLRRWAPRLGRQAVVVNKVDRLGLEDAVRVRADLAAGLASEGLAGVPVLLASATHGIDPVQAWLNSGVQAKEVVGERLRASAADAVVALVAQAGVAGDDVPVPIAPVHARSAAVAETSRAVLDVVDLVGLRDRAMAATRAAAIASGGRPLVLVRSLVKRGTGEPERRADPEGFLRRWRERGSLDRAAGPVRDLVVAALPAVPPAARAGLTALSDPQALTPHSEAVLDHVAGAQAGRLAVPASRWWAALGAGRLVGLGAVLAGAVWLVALLAAGGTVGSAAIDVPLLGPLPTPAALVLLGLAAWLGFGRARVEHARRVGSAWADSLAEEVRAAVARVVEEVVDVPLAEHDAARRELWSAWRSLTGEAGREA
jgi:hypothetical protein